MYIDSRIPFHPLDTLKDLYPTSTSVLLLLKIYLSEDYQYNIAFSEDGFSHEKILIEEVLHLVL